MATDDFGGGRGVFAASAQLIECSRGTWFTAKLGNDTCRPPPRGGMEEPWDEGLDISENNPAPLWPEPTHPDWKHRVKQRTGRASRKENGAGSSPCR